jgi:L-aspartate oxidase
VQSVESLLWREAGVRRSGEGLVNARQLLASWAPLVLDREMPHPAGMEAQNLCLLGSLLVESALCREETRGVHWRTDHSARDDDRFLGHFCVVRDEEPRFEALVAGEPIA